MMLDILFYLLMAVYALDIILLFVFGVHAYVMVILSRRNRERCVSEDESALAASFATVDDYPFVTIQLPVFNEYYVVERLIRTTMEVDWPKHRFEVQLLDDSTDESRDLAARVIAEYQAQGFNVHHLHRVDRKEHKAGALRAGLAAAKGEYVAVFDADFLPTKEFLKKTVPFFRDPEIGMVQTRWGHINADASLLTRVQSMGIDGHFIVEQVARSANSLWINFNGTGGIWRKACIVDAGNWSGDTLTEDFDLSYRAELKGWKFKYLKDVEVCAELPPLMSGFKGQQFRWCKGSIQTAIKLLPRIWRANVSWPVKLEAMFHLTSYTVHPLIIVNILCSVPLMLLQGWDRLFPESDSLRALDAAADRASGSLASALGINSEITVVLFALGLTLSIGTFGPAVFYAYSQRELHKDWIRRSLMMPLLMMVGTGIAVVNTRGWIEAVLGIKSSFKRTPKMGVSGSSDTFIGKVKYQGGVDLHVALEIVMGVICALGAYVSIRVNFTWFTGFHVIYSLGFFYVAAMTMLQTAAQRRLARRADLQVVAQAA